MIIERGDAGEVGDLSEDGVERVGLFTRLGWSISGSGRSLGASGTSCVVGSTLVHELVADKLVDDGDVLSRTVIVAHCVPSLQRQRKTLADK